MELNITLWALAGALVLNSLLLVFFVFAWGNARQNLEEEEERYEEIHIIYDELRRDVRGLKGLIDLDTEIPMAEIDREIDLIHDKMFEREEEYHYS